MKIDKIISMASGRVRLRFLAMERSLRAVGCDLPLWVIPFNDDRFTLPPNAQWWDVPEISGWLANQHAHPVMRKYQCLIEQNYQFVDSDVCFLRDPVAALADQEGFVTSCCHWRCVGDTVTARSFEMMSGSSTVWHQNVFNTGQFACDRKLYTSSELISTAMHPDFIYTCVRLPYHEQPGLNLLVFSSGVKISNLTLQPVRMESTWAGDYPGEYEQFWTNGRLKPYLIHWAGTDMAVSRPINDLFYSYLTSQEKAEWDEQARRQYIAAGRERRSLRVFARRVRRAWRELLKP